MVDNAATLAGELRVRLVKRSRSHTLEDRASAKTGAVTEIDAKWRRQHHFAAPERDADVRNRRLPNGRLERDLRTDATIRRSRDNRRFHGRHIVRDAGNGGARCEEACDRQKETKHDGFSGAGKDTSERRSSILPETTGSAYGNESERPLEYMSMRLRIHQRIRRPANPIGEVSHEPSRT